MSAESKTHAVESLPVLLRALRLPAFVAAFQTLADEGERQGWSCPEYLRQLAELELDERRQRRVARNLKQSVLPSGKTFDTFDRNRLSAKAKRQVAALCTGEFLGRAENVLAFGLPGRGKSHLLCAIGRELVQRGFRVLFIPAFELVESLLAAKRDLRLDKALRRLDLFDAVLIDDIGYIQQDRDEMEVLFTFLAERYERKSVMITSNLVFSQWDKIFKDPMTTAAAIDRLVHHCTILEMGGSSYRADQAQANGAAEGKARPKKGAKPTTENPICLDESSRDRRKNNPPPSHEAGTTDGEK